MLDALLKLLDAAGALVPFRVVRHWERGLYLVCGKCRGTVGPGLKVVVPGLCEVVRVSVVPEVFPTPLQTVTLRDGSSLTFSASVTVVVRDPRKAYLELGHYAETAAEIVAAVLAEGMSDADPERFDPARGKRDRLMAELLGECNGALNVYGLEATALRLNNFARGVRTLRLLLDRAVLPGGPPP